MSFGRLLYLAAIAAAAALLLRLWLFEGIYAASASMEPTLPVGVSVVLDKVTYKLRDPRRGEIVVFTSPVPPQKDMIKRVIAVGGDTVEIRDKRVYVNAAPLDEPYVRHTRGEEKLEGDTLEPRTVPEGHLFVLGDNRDESNDSSVWKDPATGERVLFLPLSSLRGKIRGFY